MCEHVVSQYFPCTSKIVLSIIIPTYNSSKFLARTLDSILSQSFSDFEILIMDGCSSDDTINIAKSYFDARIRVLSEKDRGIYDAMNKGIKKSRGEWLFFLGSDDYLSKDAVLCELFSLNHDSEDVFYGEVEGGSLLQEHKGEWRLDTIYFNRCHQAIFYRRRVFDICGLYNLRYPVCADFALNLKWFFDKRIVSKYYPIVISHYSSGGFSSHVVDKKFGFDLPLILLVYGWKIFGYNDKVRLFREYLENWKAKIYVKK